MATGGEGTGSGWGFGQTKPSSHSWPKKWSKRGHFWKSFHLSVLAKIYDGSSFPFIWSHLPLHPPPLPPPHISNLREWGIFTSTGSKHTLQGTPLSSCTFLLSPSVFRHLFLISFLLLSLPQLLLSFVLDFITLLFPCALQLSGPLLAPGQTLKDQWMSISHPLLFRHTPVYTCAHTHTHTQPANTANSCCLDDIYAQPFQFVIDWG